MKWEKYEKKMLQFERYCICKDLAASNSNYKYKSYIIYINLFLFIMKKQI